MYNYEITLIHYIENANAPFKIPINKELNTDYKSLESLKFATQNKFDLVYIPGWFDKDYLKIAKIQKKKGAIIVAGSDTQWNGSIKQILGIFYARLYLKKFIDFFWVPGVFQYEFIRKFGYKKKEIFFNLYSADTNLFDEVYKKRTSINHNLLFVGRFVEIKGISILAEVFNELKNEMVHDWKLIMIGNGPLKSYLSNFNIEIVDFQQPDELKKFALNAGAFILPSTFEPWGVVVHEFSAAGLPLILSDACGSHVQFLRDNYNGFLFEPNNKQSLKMSLKRLFSATDEELKLMGKRSNILSKTTSPEQWSSIFNSFLFK